MSKNADGLLEYIPGSRPVLLQRGAGPPPEGFAENICTSTREYAEDARN